MQGDGPRDAETDAYLEKVVGRLTEAGYTWTDRPSGFRAVATRSSFQPTKFGVWETFFVFRDFERLDDESRRSFMRDAHEHALAHRRSKLPRGVFAGLATFGVALADTADDAVLAAARTDPPPKHWAAMETLVVHERTSGRIHYYEKTQVWGAAYYRGLRKQIERFLAP